MDHSVSDQTDTFKFSVFTYIHLNKTRNICICVYRGITRKLCSTQSCLQATKMPQLYGLVRYYPIFYISTSQKVQIIIFDFSLHLYVDVTSLYEGHQRAANPYRTKTSKNSSINKGSFLWKRGWVRTWNEPQILVTNIRQHLGPFFYGSANFT